MEKYEINKYINIFNKKTEDLHASLHIVEALEVTERITKLMSETNFWDDKDKAQNLLKDLTFNKNKLDKYNKAKNGLNDLLELIELSELEPGSEELVEEEILSFDKLLNELEIDAILSDKYDNMPAILEIHPGAGGTESQDWADMLYRLYLRYSEKAGFKVKVLDYEKGEVAGLKSVTLLIKGDYAYGKLKAERGVHRLVRISPFDSNKRRHTSFASIDVTPEIINNDEIIVKPEDIKIDVYHSSGAGGQSVNTTDSAVRITHLATNIVVTCQNERSQIQNREFAMNILKSKLLNLEIERREQELAKEKGEQSAIGFGSQIRSYVFHPYTMVKDHRTNYEVGNINAVMDGDIEGFIISYLKLNASK